MIQPAVDIDDLKSIKPPNLPPGSVSFYSVDVSLLPDGRVPSGFIERHGLGPWSDAITSAFAFARGRLVAGEMHTLTLAQIRPGSVVTPELVLAVHDGRRLVVTTATGLTVHTKDSSPSLGKTLEPFRLYYVGAGLVLGFQTPPNLTYRILVLG